MHSHGEAVTVAGRRPRNPRGAGGVLRRELEDAAVGLVEESGDPASITIRATAARNGIAPTSVYLHFADVAALRTAAERGFELFAEARDGAADPEAGPAEGLLGRARAYVRFAVEHPGLYRLMLGPTIPELSMSADRAGPSRDALQGLADSIRACQAAGLCDDTVPAEPPSRSSCGRSSTESPCSRSTDPPCVCRPRTSSGRPFLGCSVSVRQNRSVDRIAAAPWAWSSRRNHGTGAGIRPLAGRRRPRGLAALRLARLRAC